MKWRRDKSGDWVSGNWLISRHWREGHGWEIDNLGGFPYCVAATAPTLRKAKQLAAELKSAIDAVMESKP